MKMRNSLSTLLFPASFALVLLSHLERVNAIGASALDDIVRNGDEVVKHAPKVVTGIVALFTANPLLTIAIVVIALLVIGKLSASS